MCGVMVENSFRCFVLLVAPGGSFLTYQVEQADLVYRDAALASSASAGSASEEADANSSGFRD